MSRAAIKLRSGIPTLSTRTILASTPLSGPSRLPSIAHAARSPVSSSRIVRPALLSPQSLYNRSFASAATSPVPRASPTPSPNDLSSSNTSANARSEAEAESEPGEEPEEPVPPNSSAYERLKIMSKKYGWWALGMYLALSSVDFSLCFVAVHAFGAERISPLLDSGKQFYREKRYGEEEANRLRDQDLAERQEQLKEAKKEDKKGVTFGATFWTEVALAYAIHKTALLPIRAGLTVAWTPKLVGWLTRRGWVGKVSRRLHQKSFVITFAVGINCADSHLTGRPHSRSYSRPRQSPRCLGPSQRARR